MSTAELLPPIPSLLAEEQRLLIDGEHVPAADGRTFESLDPATAAPLAQVAWARGMYEDAVVFAREAETLDPRHALAAGLAARLEATALERASSSPVDVR